MCGIVGALSFNDSSFRVTESYISTMRDSMAHRGPDGKGVWVSSDRRVGLGHRRLSIIDLSEQANQPMSNQSGTIHIVYNGEIYNHEEIRQELTKQADYKWKTNNSDTEVILHAFDQWGIDCVHRFRGMFAFAIWDSIKKELWLVRDRVGVKPLYYSIHNGRIVFASEIKALLQDTEQSREINEEGFYHYLSFLTIPAPNTLFKNIYKLAPGTWVRVQCNGRMKTYNYWDVLEHLNPLYNESENEIAERLLCELRDSVHYRRNSDVPVGIFLSGGIDSSTNTALFSENQQEKVKTFSIGYKGETSYKNELNHAKFMADVVGADYHEKLLSIDELIDFMPKMVWLQDEPIADPVCFPVYYVSKLARDHGVTVCQVGEGADELFLGYPTWKKRLIAQNLNKFPVPKVIKKSFLFTMGAAGMKSSYHYEYLRRACLDQPIQWSGSEAFTHVEKNQLITASLKKRLDVTSSWDCLIPDYEYFINNHYSPNSLDLMSYMDLKFRLPELLLMRVDKMSMGASLEARVPFLDHKFVELAMSIPPKIKFKNGILKYILKKSVRGLIPDKIIDRPKQGFGVPVNDWMLGKLEKSVREELQFFCKQTDLINLEQVENIMNSSSRSKIWPLYNMALWFRKNFI